MMKSYLPLLIVFLSFSDLKPQPHQYNFSLIDNNNGLSHNQVNTIYKDHKGFMWFGTMSGLNRYDGYNFKVFLHNNEDSTSINDNYISRIFQGPEEKIWVITRKGINIYDPVTEGFHLLGPTALQKYGLPDLAISEIIRDSKDNLWFLHQDKGLFKLGPNSNKAINVSFEPDEVTAMASNQVTAMAEDPEGNYWLMHKNGILEKMNSRQHEIIFRDSTFYHKYQKKNYDYNIFIDSENDLWIFVVDEPKGVFYFNSENNEIKHFHKQSQQFRLNSNLIRGITQDNADRIWIGTDHGGVNLINKSDFSVTYILNEPDDEKSLVHNSIYSLYKDNSGIIWIGTFKKGVNYYHENLVKFPLYNSKTLSVANPNFNDINHFAEDSKGNIWIGTNGNGLYYYDRSSGKVNHYLHDPKNPNSLSNNVIICLLIDSEQNLWVGTYYGGLNYFDGSEFVRFTHNPDNPKSISDDRVWHIYEDSQKNLWVGTLGGGLDRFDRVTNTFYHYKKGEEKSIHCNDISSILEDKDGNIFVATFYGLNVKEKSADNFKHYTSNDGLSNENIFSMIEDYRGFIWLGTRDGLNFYDKKSGAFKVFKKEDGLPDNMILSIIEDKFNNLWLSTSNGISHLTINKLAGGGSYSFNFRNYTTSDGLQGKSFNEKSGFKTRNGEIIFAGANGFNLFNPKNIKVNEDAPPVVLTDFQIFNKSIKAGEKINGRMLLSESISEINKIELKHDENMFTLEFAALNYFHPEQNKYAYKMEGFNDEWLITDANSRRATFTNLNPGEYIFKVKASNNDGIWNENGINLKIIVLPPFWKSDTAFFVYFIISLGLLYAGHQRIKNRERERYKIELERQEAQRIHELDLMKIKFFTNMSHEFRTPLSLILAPLDSLMKTNNPHQKHQFQMLYRNARRLLNLVNQLLDFRKIEFQGLKLNLSEGDIILFIKDIAYSFTDLSENKNIKFSFTSNNQSFETFFDQDKLEKILFNLVSNAFKFTPENGNIEICVDLKENSDADEVQWLKIQVKDSGIGIPYDKAEAIFERFFQLEVPEFVVNQGSGIGLSITKEFIKLHGGAIHVESEPGKGSCFTVSLPLKPLPSGGSNRPISEEILPPEALGEIIPKGITLPKRRDISILIIEDNEDFRFYLKDNLKDNYTILEAGNGKEGFSKAVANVPDLIVSDIMMPEMGGLELCKKIKGDKRTCHIPLILLTAHAAEEQKLLGYETGANDYITKPFNFKILISRIKNLLIQRDNLQKAFKEKVEINPGEIDIISLDDKLINKAIDLVEKNISNAEFSVIDLSKELGMSRSQLYKKIHSITGKSPQNFIRIIRLKRAAQLLKKSQLTVAEVAYQVGYNNPKYFAKNFKSEFNTLPSVYSSNRIS